MPIVHRTAARLILLTALIAAVILAVNLCTRPAETPDAEETLPRTVPLPPSLLGSTRHAPGVGSGTSTGSLRAPTQSERLQVRGRVLDSERAPVPKGGAVRLLAYSPEAGRLRWLEETVIGEDGRFAIGIGELGDALASLAISARGGGATQIPLSPNVALHGGDIGDIVLGRGVHVTGRLVDAQGSGSSGRTVRWRAPMHAGIGGVGPTDLSGLALGSVVTGEDGEFDLGFITPGTLWFWADRPGHVRAFVGAFAVRPEADVLTVLLREPDERDVPFRVVSPSGPLPDEAEVQAFYSYSDIPDYSLTVDIDAAGRFDLPLPMGFLGKVRVTAPGYRLADVSPWRSSETPVEVTLMPLPRDLALALPPFEAGQAVRVGLAFGDSRRDRLPRLVPVIVRSDGVLQHPNLARWASANTQFVVLRSDGTGAYLSPLLAAADLEEGRSPISCQAVEATTVQLHVEGDVPQGTVARVMRGASPAASPVRTVRGLSLVTPSGLASLEDVLLSAPVETDGYVELRLTPGFRYRVEIRVQGRAPRHLDIGPLLPPRVSLPQPATGSLTVRVDEDVARYWGGLALLQSETGIVIAEWPDAGTHTLHDIVDGTYMVTPRLLAGWVMSLPDWGLLTPNRGFALLHSGASPQLITLTADWEPAWVSGKITGGASEGFVDIVPAGAPPGLAPISPASPTPDGEFEMGPLPEGNYLVRLFRQGAAPTCQAVYLRAGEAVRVVIRGQ